MDTDRFATLSRALGAGTSPPERPRPGTGHPGSECAPAQRQRGEEAQAAQEAAAQRIWLRQRRQGLPRQGQRLLLGHLPGQEAEKGREGHVQVRRT